MSTKEQCKYYEQCGFVHFRKNASNNSHAIALPKNGDCGINQENCLRIQAIEDPELNNGPNPIRIEEFSPSNETEFNVGFNKKSL